MMAKKGPKPRPWQDRFLEKINKTEGCWLWLAGGSKKGYGRFGISAGNVKEAHVVSYMLFKGSIPTGYQIDHLCRVRLCVNPEHLEAVTQRENLIRGNGWAGRNYRKTECPKGHPLSGENILLHHERRECRRCHNDRQKRRYYANKRKGK